jgi:hypothetical protein
VLGAIEGRPDQLRHPGVDHDQAARPVVGRRARRDDRQPVGSRAVDRRGRGGANPLADVEDAGDQPAGPGDDDAPGLHRQPARPAIRRDRIEQAGELRGEALGRGSDRAGEGVATARLPADGRHATPDVEGVEVGQRALYQRQESERAPDRVAPGIDGAQL